jgi:hypothetical protein
MVTVMLAACTPPRAPARAPVQAPVLTPSGLYWGRWQDVPDGLRVQVWLHGVGRRLRGTWELPPWHGEITGTLAPDGRWHLTWREEAVVGGLRARVRSVRLTVDGPTGTLHGDGVVLSWAGDPSPTLRAGLWLARWTGLPPGVAVETVLARDPDGRWRAAYHYQDREGSFEGQRTPHGGLAIRWRELSPGGRVAEGRGMLAPCALGLSGTYGVGEASEGTGTWSLEPAGGFP